MVSFLFHKTCHTALLFLYIVHMFDTLEEWGVTKCFQYVDEILHTGSFNLRDVFILNVLPQHGFININLLNIQNLWSLCILDSAIAGSKPGWKRRRVGHGVATTSRVMGSSNMHFGPILMQFRDFNQLKNANFSRFVVSQFTFMHVAVLKPFSKWISIISGT